jgi:hypothetical protein
MNDSVNATNPAVTYQPSLHIAIAWQADNGGLHDVYARFLSNTGQPKPNPCNGNLTDPVRVNAQGLDATLPAATADASGSVFIAWQEYDSATLNGKIMIRKYDTNGCPLSAPVQVDNNGLGGTTRNEVALATAANAVCSATNSTCATDADCPSGEHCSRHLIAAAWWEGRSDGSLPEYVNRRRLTSDLGPLDNEAQVNSPPLAPPGAQRGARVSVATDTSRNVVVSWQANVNDSTANTWKGFARTYNRSGTTVKNDFRIDLAPRTAAARSPRAARSSQAGKFVYAWRDNRTSASRYDVYTRVAPSVP